MLTQNLAKRPKEAPKMAAACVPMTTNAIRPKGPGLGFVLESDSLDDLIGNAAASVIEISGVIKWFDVSKGFGFIVPDNGMADVLLHVTCLRRDGFQTAHEGARIVVEGVAEDGTIEAIRVADAPSFALGVQWHAEHDPQTNRFNRVLFEAFGAALLTYKRTF